jgi:hypothetical protein
MMPQTPAALPGAMAGSPPGPGSSPMAAPGGGAGNTAAAVASLKGAFPLLYKLLSAFPPGSEDWKNVSEMIKFGGKIVGKTQDESLVPSAIQQMAMAAKGGPMKNAPPVGIQSANTNVAPKAEAEPI